MSINPFSSLVLLMQLSSVQLCCLLFSSQLLNILFQLLTMFKLTAGISPNLFVLYVSQYIYLKSIYFNINRSNNRPLLVVTTSRKATDIWPSHLTIELLSDWLLKNGGGGGGGYRELTKIQQ